MLFKRPLKPALTLLLLIAMISLGACSQSYPTFMSFSFSTSAPADSVREKIIYINSNIDSLRLNAKLQMDFGTVYIQILSIDDEEVIWSNSYEDDSSFIIELSNLEANSEYLIRIDTIQSQRVQLSITSDSKLVEAREKPDR
ncbi:MAG: DUF4624 family lipoprotein [Defluviitaleaceae bacterium]|nr:DUF4624 family lipoprotein [Defluviitaleaceae bacterium]